ncbi:MAG: ABC transporter permease [Chitinophagales bacterium]|nr:ABC transporter permease [Chitinophagales bacterium]
MLRLLRIEFLKVKTYKTFWAFLGIYALLILLFSGAANKMNPAANPAFSLFSFPEVWHNLAYMASYLNILLGILVILLISNEFTFKTFRQNVVDGLSRDEAVTAKFLFIKAIALGCILFLFIYGLIRGLTAGGFDFIGQIFEQVHFLLRLFVQIAGYMGIAAVLAFLIRRAALAIVAYLIYVIALERLLRFRIPDEIERYLPMHVLDALVPSKFEIPIPGFTEAEPLSTTIVVLLAIGYFLLCLTFSRLLMQRSAL